jgi:diguanylate cyclase (GGDEF)-like protein
VIDIEGQPVPDGGWVVVIRDTTGERAAMAELNREARRCPLTGLANRRAFMEELERRCLAAGDRHFALVLVDLDGFKQVNDRHGHPVGDRVITRVGYRLRTALPGLFVARLGGDEFAVLADLADQPDVLALASKLGDVVQQPAQFGDAHVQLGAAIGVALAPRDGRDSGALLRAADLALLSAKTNAGSSIVLFESALAEAAAVRLDEEARVQAALRSGAIDVAYQPLVDLATGRVIGIEALARWPGWANETLAAQRIVAIAEARGQIAVLRRLVLARALPVLSGLPATVSLWLNISVADLATPGFAEELMAAMLAAGIAPQRLVLEITETGLMTGEDGSASVLAALRARGVRVAMDDFGAGFSSLARLAQMPLDVIKISSALIAGSSQSELSGSIITAAARIGHSRGLKIVAEGIESAGDLERVEQAGIDCAQGYHLARPVLAPHLPAAIAEAQARMGRVSRKVARASELPPAA